MVPLTVVAADAAALGGLSARTLAVVSQATSAGAPTVLGCDNFTGTTGASLSARAATVASNCGNAVWTSHIGAWTIQSNQAASAATADANATVNVGAANSSVQIDLISLNLAGRLAGVVASHNGTSTYLAAVLTKGSPDVIELRLYQAGTPTVIATGNPTIVTTNTLKMTRNGSALTVVLNAATILTATLTAAQVTALGSGQRAGIFGGNSTVRFDNLLVTSP